MGPQAQRALRFSRGDVGKAADIALKMREKEKVMIWQYRESSHETQ